MPITTHITQVNGQPTEATSRLVCDRTGCDSQIDWNAMPTPGMKLPSALEHVVEIVHTQTQKKLLLCSAECAIMALNAGQHLPPKVELATSDQAKEAVANAGKVTEMKVRR